MKWKVLIVISLLTMKVIAQNVIDVHSHIITPDFLSNLKQDNRLLEEGFPLPAWNEDSLLTWMDRSGIQTSVLTLAAPQPSSAQTVRATNIAAAELKKKTNGRILFCAALPLPNVKDAINEAIFALDHLQADGIKLATNADGQYLGNPELDTLFATLNQRNAVIILHPHRPNPVNEQVMNQTPLAMQEYLSETTRAVANMITRNVMARYPNMKIVVPHCGAYLPLAVPRMKSLTPVMQKNNMVGQIDWEKNLSALYYDLAGAHSPETIRMLLTITKPEHLLYGSDYPYAAPDALTASLNRMRDYLSSERDLAPYKEMILHENAEWLFGLSATQPTTKTNDNQMLFRLAEIEIFPEFIEQFTAAGKEIQQTTMAEEPGVFCLLPVKMNDDATQFRVIEIYSSQEAYQHHIQTAHFKRYKQTTNKMVKSLKLNDLTPLNPSMLSEIFQYIK